MMNENVANIGKGHYTKVRYIESITKKREKNQNKSGKELVDDVIAKTGIKLVK